MLFYRVLSVLLYPFLELYLFYRLYKKKEDKKRLKERFGTASQNRPEGDLIWLHAVSVGETNSSLILVEELLESLPQTSILFTTTTLTSASIIAKKLTDFKGRVIHQFLPIDSYSCVMDFLQYWHPTKAIFVESEIWPNFIYEAHKANIKTFLVNARISKKSFKKWNFAKKIGFNIFSYFDAIFVHTPEDQALFAQLSGTAVLFYGNLKSQAQNLFCDQKELQELQLQIADRKIWVAASTHKGEEEIIITAHKKLKKEFPELLTIIVPRHPNRAEEIKLLLNGLNFAQRSKNENITTSTEIYLADSLGELGIFYSLQKFAFIGGSLVEVGGHNPFEAIKLGCAVISGKLVPNFAEIYRELEEKDACIIVDNLEQLTFAVSTLLKDRTLSEKLLNNASRVIKNSDNIVKKIASKLLAVI